MAETPDPLGTPTLPAVDGPPIMRATAGIFLGVAVATCGAYAAVTMAPVVAHDITGSAFRAGLPVAALLAGAGWGAPRVSALVQRFGHQTAFGAMYIVGLVACVLAVVAVLQANYWLLIAAVAGIGMGHAANQLARYAAAELHPEARRPAVIGWLVWAQAVGAVAGPLSLSPAGSVALSVGLPVAAGGFLVGVLLYGVAAASQLLGPRYRAASTPVGAVAADPVPARPARSVPTVQIAVATLVVALAVMLLVMTVTPVHVSGSGHGVVAVGAVMSAHTFGMFAFAPVAGWLAGRLGSLTVILGGLGVLLAAVLAGALVPASSQVLLAAALFLLGLGWCLAFVAGSALLTQGLDADLRIRLQGRVEATTWITGSVAAVGSGLLLGVVGYARLNLVAASLLLIPLATIVAHRWRRDVHLPAEGSPAA